MTHILDWEAALAIYGADLAPARNSLSEATQATFCLFASTALAGGGIGMTSRGGDHAECRLIASNFWPHIEQAMSRSDAAGKSLSFLLAINRTPCARCARVLAGALQDVRSKYPSASKHEFVMAALGYYQGKAFMREAEMSPFARLKRFPAPSQKGDPDLRYSDSVTTDRGLREMINVGWKCRVLTFGDMTPRGAEYLNFLASH